MTLPFPPEKKRQPDTSARALLDLAKITQQIKDTPGRWMENLRGMAQHPEELVLSPLRHVCVPSR